MKQLFFTEGTQPSLIITEIPGDWGYDKHPMEWKFYRGGGLQQKCPPWKGGMDIFWNYKIWAWGSINCSIWTQSCIIIVEKVTEKQSWHSLQDQGSAVISLAKPLHWRRVGCNVERISCIGCYLIFIFIYIIYIPISIIYLYIYHYSLLLGSHPILYWLRWYWMITAIISR